MKKLLLPLIAASALVAGCGETSQPVDINGTKAIYVYDDDGAADYPQVLAACNGHAPEQAIPLGSANEDVSYLVFCKQEDN